MDQAARSRKAGRARRGGTEVIRCMFWIIVHFLTLTAFDIYILYSDGVEIDLRGWSRFRK